MKEIIVALWTLTAFSSTSHSQSVSAKAQSKIDRATSKQGVTLRLEDYTLTKLQGLYVAASTRLRTIESHNIEEYFLQFVKKTNRGQEVTTIAESDLDGLVQALTDLKLSLAEDRKSNHEYLEKKYITEDDVELGYFISREKINWYLSSGKYKQSSLFFRDTQQIESIFRLTDEKIKELKLK